MLLTRTRCSRIINIHQIRLILVLSYKNLSFRYRDEKTLYQTSVICIYFTFLSKSLNSDLINFLKVKQYTSIDSTIGCLESASCNLLSRQCRRKSWLHRAVDLSTASIIHALGIIVCRTLSCKIGTDCATDRRNLIFIKIAINLNEK